MDNKDLKVVNFNPSERMEEKAEEKGWEVDEEIVEMDMSDLSKIADGFSKIREGIKLISDATGVNLESV